MNDYNQKRMNLQGPAGASQGRNWRASLLVFGDDKEQSGWKFPDPGSIRSRFRIEQGSQLTLRDRVIK
ncbi:MAG TPA: hypothetical protein DCR87_00595 [Acidobacteria bacterium]|nr:hypothetical protein [Acidobacteriota bacterium]